MENKTIHQRLCEIQKQLKVGKTHNNAFGKYQYRKAEDILSAIKDFLQDNEYITTSANIQVIQDRFYVVITASFHKENEVITANGYARESFEKKGMDDAQLTGATTSYAKKYALCNLFAIDDEIDADDENYSEKTQQEKPKEPAKQTLEEKKLTDVEYKKLEDGIKNCQTVGKLIEYATTTLTNNKPKMSETQYNKLKTMLDGYKNTLTKAEVDKINAKNN